MSQFCPRLCRVTFNYSFNPIALLFRLLIFSALNVGMSYVPEFCILLLKTLPIHVYWWTICYSSKKMEPTQMFIYRWVDGENKIHIHISLNHKKNTVKKFAGKWIDLMWYKMRWKKKNACSPSNTCIYVSRCMGGHSIKFSKQI